MLLVKTHLDKSPIHGIGLFASEFIPKGTKIWELQVFFDLVLDQISFDALPELTQQYIMHYEHFDETLNKHILCGDNARFFNKSENPNCGGECHNISFALRDISEGEELTEIYYNLKEIESLKLIH